MSVATKLQMFPEELICALKVRSGRAWNAEEVLGEAERYLVCELMLGMAQSGKRAGIGLGNGKSLGRR